MTHDDAKCPPDRRFTHAGIGHVSGRLCAYCHKSRLQLGGKLIGELRRFKCFPCVKGSHADN